MHSDAEFLIMSLCRHRCTIKVVQTPPYTPTPHPRQPYVHGLSLPCGGELVPYQLGGREV